MPKQRKDKIGSFRTSVAPAIADLAAATGVGATMSLSAMKNACTVIKIRLTGRILTNATDTPLELFLATSELSDSEIEAFVELNGPDEPGQITEGEIISRGRLIKSLGMIPQHGEVVQDDTMSCDIETSLTLSLREDHGLRLFVYNHGTGALGAGAAMTLRVNAVVRWHPE